MEYFAQHIQTISEEEQRQRKASNLRLLGEYQEETDAKTKEELVRTFQKNREAIRSLFLEDEYRDEVWDELLRLLTLEEKEDAKMKKSAQDLVSALFSTEIPSLLREQKIDKPFSWKVAQMLVISKGKKMSGETGPMKVLCDDLQEIFAAFTTELLDGKGEDVEGIVDTIEIFGPVSARRRILGLYLFIAERLGEDAFINLHLIDKIYGMNQERALALLETRLEAYGLPAREILDA